MGAGGGSHGLTPTSGARGAGLIAQQACGVQVQLDPPYGRGSVVHRFETSYMDTVQEPVVGTIFF